MTTEEHKVLIERAYVAVMSIIACRSNVQSRQVKDYLLPNATTEEREKRDKVVQFSRTVHDKKVKN